MNVGNFSVEQNQRPTHIEKKSRETNPSTHFLVQTMKKKNWVELVMVVKSRDDSVGIATDYRLDDRMIGFRILAGAGNFSLRHHVQTGSGAHPVSYPMGTGGSFPGGKAAGAWSWPLTFI
jgi:hypothetical protein